MKAKRILSDIHRLASRALKAAIRNLIKERAREGRSLVVWRNGKVVRVSARRILRKQKAAKLKKRKISLNSASKMNGGLFARPRSTKIKPTNSFSVTSVS